MLDLCIQAMLRCLAILLFLLAPLCADSSAEFDGKIVREIRVTGATIITPEQVVRQMQSKVGEPFHPDKIREDHELLERLAIFSAIDIQPVADGDGVALEVTVKEISRYFPYPSLDVNAENGIALGAGLKAANPRNWPLSASAAARFGGSTQVEVILERQWRTWDPFYYRFDFFYRKRFNELDLFDETAFEPTFRAGYNLSRVFRIGGIGKFTSLASKQDGITLSGGPRDNVGAAGFFAEYDSRDSWFLTRHGWWNEFDVTRSFGDGSYWTANFDVRRYHPIAARHSIAAFSLMTLQSGTVGLNIPIWANYHLGGTNSIRGWDINARQGKNQFINTVEYRYDLMKPRPLKIWNLKLRLGLQLAAFGDFGTAWDESDQFTKNFIGGAGFGVRIMLPWIQMLRFDFGFGQSGAGLQSHIGTFEKAVYQRRRVR